MTQTQVQVPYTDVATIVAVVADYYGTTPAAMMAPGRAPELVEARHVCVQLLWEYGAGTSQAGRAVGRDHATANHALRQMENRLTRERWEALQACRREVRGRLARGLVAR